MSNNLRNSTKVMAAENATTIVPVTIGLLREVAKVVTTEMTKMLVDVTTVKSTELPSTTTTTTRATTTTTSTATTRTTTMKITPTQIPSTTQSSWDLTKTTATAGIVNATNATKTCSTTTTVDPFDEFGPPEGVEYIFVPLGVMIFVIVLSAVVLIISRRRKLERLRHRLMPLYNFDPGEEGEDDWETELLDEGFGSRQRRQGYQSMDSEENAELFGPH